MGTARRSKESKGTEKEHTGEKKLVQHMRPVEVWWQEEGGPEECWIKSTREKQGSGVSRNTTNHLFPSNGPPAPCLITLCCQSPREVEAASWDGKG